jgi:hypothetical protein
LNNRAVHAIANWNKASWPYDQRQVQFPWWDIVMENRDLFLDEVEGFFD